MGGESGRSIGSGIGPYVVGKGVKSPQVLVKPAPKYTEEGRKGRAEGSVLIEAVIRKDGSFDNFGILRGLWCALDEMAINTIETKWLFMPVTKNGVPVNVWINVEVTFHLN